MPSLGPIAQISLAENSPAGTTVTTASATDPDGDTLTYRLGGADAAAFAIDADTGEITLAVGPDFEAPADADGDNTYELTVTAADPDGAEASESFTVEVQDVTEAPPEEQIGLDLIGNVDDYRIIAHGDTLVFRHQGFEDGSGLGRTIARVENVERFEGVDLEDLTVEDGFDLRAREATAGPPDDLSGIRDFDGNDLGAPEGWKFIGTADAQYDGDAEHVYVNPEIGRWATVGPDENGTIDFGDHGQGGDTRVVGIYIDPLVESGEVERGSDIDSQRRFQNDLEIDNLELQTAFDFDADGFQEMYFKTVDGTAYLRALMHADGNIQYANYQSEDQVRDYLDGLGYGAEVIDTILV